MKNQQCFLLGLNPVFHGTSTLLYQVQHFCIQFERLFQITVNISENSSESSPTDKAKLKVDFCIESSIGIVKLATGGLYREL